jgi:Flp pilus assembly secretin CpaC
MRSWQRLTLRAGVGQKATAFIGTRFPVIFSTFSSSFLPAITQELIRRGELLPPVPAFRYEELGLKLTVTPQVHPKREISLEMKLEQMALTGQAINDIPVLSSRVVEDQVRFRSGESLLIAGLRRESQDKGTTSIPGLGALPLIGPLFSRLEPDTQTNELILLITPRFTRLPAKERLLTRTLYVGTEKDFAPVGPAPLAAPRAPQPPQPPPTQPPTPQQPPQTPPAQPPTQPQPPPQPQPPQN